MVIFEREIMMMSWKPVIPGAVYSKGVFTLNDVEFKRDLHDNSEDDLRKLMKMLNIKIGKERKPGMIKKITAHAKGKDVVKRVTTAEKITMICEKFKEKGITDEDIREVLFSIPGLPKSLPWTKLKKPVKPTGLRIYKDENLERAKEEYPDADSKEINKLLSQEWKDLEKDEKKTYNNRASELLDTYHEELETYQKYVKPKKRASKKAKTEEAPEVSEAEAETEEAPEVPEVPETEEAPEVETEEAPEVPEAETEEAPEVPEVPETEEAPEAETEEAPDTEAEEAPEAETEEAPDTEAEEAPDTEAEDSETENVFGDLTE